MMKRERREIAEGGKREGRAEEMEKRLRWSGRRRDRWYQHRDGNDSRDDYLYKLDGRMSKESEKGRNGGAGSENRLRRKVDRIVNIYHTK